jgi:hypothetical protein
MWVEIEKIVMFVLLKTGGFFGRGSVAENLLLILRWRGLVAMSLFLSCVTQRTGTRRLGMRATHPPPALSFL